MTGRLSARRHYVTLILEALNRAPEARRLHCREGSFTGAQVTRSVYQAAAALRAAGARTGSVVALLTAANHPLTLTARWAAHLLGVTVVYVRSVNPGADAPLAPETQAGMLRECGVGLLVVDRAHAALGARLAGLVPEAPPVVALDFPADVADVPAPGGAVAPDCAVITHTSGSTGRPKGVRQSFTSWNDLVVSDAARAAGRSETMLVVTPTSHTVAVLADVVLASGGRLVVHERFDAGEFLRAVAVEGVTMTYLAVPQLYRVLDHPSLAVTDLSSMRQLVYSGAPASPARIASALRVFGPALVQCYGSTEAGRITLLDQLDHAERELLPSVGRPFPGVEVRICDPSSGRVLPEGAAGEVLVRSPHRMSGYQDATDTGRVMRGDWLRTGDLGRWDGYGCLHLVGRVDRVIKTAGTKVHPAEVERALLSHPAVADCAVYGVRDEDALEAVHAAVVLRAPQHPDGLRDHVAALLSPAHVPSEIVRWAEIPLLDSGKPDLVRLRGGESPHALPAFQDKELTP